MAFADIGVILLGISGFSLLFYWFVKLIDVVDDVQKGRRPWWHSVLLFTVVPLIGLLLVIFG